MDDKKMTLTRWLCFDSSG